MRKTIIALLAGWAALPAAAIEPAIATGEEVEARFDGDLDGDGTADLAYVVGTGEWRELRVALSRGTEIEALDLERDPLGPGVLSIDGDVLEFRDRTGSTTAYSSTRRFRYDPVRRRMRLIGIEARRYSPTFAHGGFEASWNLVNGDSTTRELRLDRSGGQPAYKPGRESSAKRRVRPLWLADAPDPASLIEEMGEG